MSFKPVDFSEEKEELLEKADVLRKGKEAAVKTEEQVQFEKVIDEVEEFLDSVARGLSPFGRIPIQLDSLLCTRALGEMRKVFFDTFCP